MQSYMMFKHHVKVGGCAFTKLRSHLITKALLAFWQGNI